MCLNVTNDKYDIGLRYAVDDIKCFMIVKPSLSSIDDVFNFTIGDIYETETKDMIYECENYLDGKYECLSMEDLQSLLSQELYRISTQRNFPYRFHRIVSGFCSYLSIEDAKDDLLNVFTDKMYILAECVIPKHTWYYMGKNSHVFRQKNAYMSERIMIKSIINGCCSFDNFIL